MSTGQKLGHSSNATTVTEAAVFVHDNYKSAWKLPNLKTNYEYNVKIGEGKIRIEASSVYGALYGMESLLQLVDKESGTIAGDDIEIVDKPDYAWRGLMIDSGRRFFPMPLVKNLLDTMASAKLNVLHLHASDMCRCSRVTEKKAVVSVFS